ncbi:MAG: metal ABC transporter ATP-binding protein [Patescibacteria group bacterium]
MKAIIEADNLTVCYGSSEAIKDITFSVYSGDFVGLTGPNGSGKTTVIKALLGLLPITKGKISLFGQTQKSFTDWGKIGYLPQKLSSLNPLFPASVEEVVFLGLLSKKKMLKIITKDDKEKVQKILNVLEISDLKNKTLSELSGGQQQRVMLARSLVAEPDVLIFDEPSTALDPESREAFFALIQKLNKENGIAIILITHDIGCIGSFANKLMYLDKNLIYFGSFSEFCRSGKMSSYFGPDSQHIICHQHN